MPVRGKGASLCTNLVFIYDVVLCNCMIYIFHLHTLDVVGRFSQTSCSFYCNTICYDI